MLGFSITDPSNSLEWMIFLAKKYSGMFLEGTWLTLYIAVAGTILGFLLGYIIGIIQDIRINEGDSILKKGIFIHQTNELRLEKVESVNIHKSFWGLIFGYATLIFTGTGNKVIKFDGIANPQKVKNEIDEVFETYAK